MKCTLIVAVGLMTALQVFAQPTATSPAASQAHRPALSTKSFVTRLAHSDMFETKSSELAAVRGGEKVRDFAASMIGDHQKSSSELSLFVKPQVDKMPLPLQLDRADKAKIDRLKRLDGKAFDQAYMDDQIGAHEAAISLLTRYSKDGAHAELKAFAASLLPKIGHHLDMARELRKGL